MSPSYLRTRSLEREANRLPTVSSGDWFVWRSDIEDFIPTGTRNAYDGFGVVDAFAAEAPGCRDEALVVFLRWVADK